MAMRRTILQQKLEELESQLNQVISFPSKTPCRHRPLPFDIRQRFNFFNNLLSAERSSVSHYPLKPYGDLHDIGHRLSRLESAFYVWEEFMASATPDHVGKVSTCYCTESCQNDYGLDNYSEMSSLDDEGGDNCSVADEHLKGEGREKEASEAEAEAGEQYKDDGGEEAEAGEQPKGEGGEAEMVEAAAGEAERCVGMEEGKIVFMGGRCGLMAVCAVLLSIVILTFSSVEYRKHDFFATPT